MHYENSNRWEENRGHEDVQLYAQCKATADHILVKVTIRCQPDVSQVFRLLTGFTPEK